MLLLPWQQGIAYGLLSRSFARIAPLLPVDLEGAQTPRFLLLGRKYAPRHAALCAVKFPLEGARLAGPYWVDRAPLARPVLEVLRMRCELDLELSQFEKGLSYGRRESRLA
jgi:hypothetical protein